MRKSLSVVVLVALGACAARGQVSAEQDPANLAGERVAVRGGYPEISINEGAPALQQLLPKLRTRASLMLIVAHPDDEDGGMLTFLSRGLGARVAMLTLTRGEGGQNLMSADFDDALGLIRTQELLAADRYMGVDQMFGTVVDFGFSKTREEAMAKWGHDRVLYDAVRAVRLYRPLVVASVFVGGVTDGHGQHQVSGEIAQEVYLAAGDPKVFPEMGLAPWSPLKVYARVPFSRVTKETMFDYATGKSLPTRFYNYVTKTWTTDVPKANVTVHEGDTSPALGMSYVQFARQGLALQKSQIGAGARLAPAGAFDSGYTRFASRVSSGMEEANFFDGIDVSLGGIASLAPMDHGDLRVGLQAVDQAAARAASVFNMEAPERCAPALAEGLRTLDALIAGLGEPRSHAAGDASALHELKVKRVQFNDALLLAISNKSEAHLQGGQSGLLVPGQRIDVEMDFSSKIGWKYEGAKVEPYTVRKNSESTADLVTGGSKIYSDRVALQLPEQGNWTEPYFRKSDLEQAYYEVSTPALRDAATSPYALVATNTVLFDGVTLEMRTAVANGSRGSTTAVEIVSPVSVAISPRAGIVPTSVKSFTLTARVRSILPGTSGTLQLELPPGWSSSPTAATFSAAADQKDTEVPFVVTPARLNGSEQYTLTAVVTVAGKEYREGYRAVGYKGLVKTNYYRSATYRTGGVDVKVAPGLRVGYLSGTGDAVPESLSNLRVKVTMLSVADVVAGRLAGFDTVVLGVRAYAAHPELLGDGSAKLVEFARAGGTVVVQYNTGGYGGNVGPYPFSGGSDEKVVDETDRVTLLKPNDPLLTTPNRITARDFDGWVAERGHGFMGTWDPHYEALLEMHDPEQDPQKGGLLVARAGKGIWIYCALALYRELPEGVPGAYRLFANLLSGGRQ